jgi:hypothetical protein
MFFSIVYAYYLELLTGVFINGGRTMDWIKDLEQTAKPFLFIIAEPTNS